MRSCLGRNLVLLIILTTVCPAVRASDLAGTLGKIHAAARQAQAEGRLHDVEMLRRRRLSELEAVVEEGGGDSAWIEGMVAIREAERHVDALRYREALSGLGQAWTRCLAAPRGEPVFGDVGVCMFEVAQQALAIYPDSLTEGHATQIATRDELQTALETALDRDPCQVEARVMLSFLTEINPGEAFLRAEVRPTIKARNAMLVNLSRSPEASSAVMPWHAAVEWLKAGNSLAILQDLVPVDQFLGLPESGAEKGQPLMLSGFDANEAPFRIDLNRREILMDVPDARGVPRPAIVTLVDGEWRKMDIRLLWKKSNSTPAVTPTDKVWSSRFEELVPADAWETRDGECGIYDLPVELAGEVFGRLPWMTVTASDALRPRIKGDRSPSLAESVDWFQTDRQVLRGLVDFSRTTPQQPRDEPADPVAYLLGLPGLNPLLVFSFDGSAEAARPAFFDPDGDPHLFLDDGTRLDMRATSGELVVDFPVARGHAPLTMQSVPEPLLRATRAGTVLRDLLLKAGYTEEDFAEHINLADRTYIPAKFDKFLRGFARRRRLHPEPAFQELLLNAGWQEPESPIDDLRSRFADYGFRYLRLRDARSSLITNLDLLHEEGEGSQRPPGLLYDTRSPDGQESIAEQNLYTAADYARLYDNVRNVFYPRMFTYHPCIPTAVLLNAFDAEPPPRALKAAVFSTTGLDSSPTSLGTCPPWEEVDESLEKLVEQLTSNYQSVVGSLRSENGYSSGGPGSEGLSPIFRIQHAAARNLAREGHYHRAIVFFNDIVRGLQNTRPLDTSLFGKVPNPEELARFGKEFARLIENQRFAIIVQAEQGGVLRAAGLEESALFLWRGIVDQYRLYTLPMLDLADEYGRSYGFMMPDEVRRARQNIELYVAAIDRAAGSRKPLPDPSLAHDDDVRATTILKELEAMWAGEAQKPADSDGKPELEEMAANEEGRKSLDATLVELLGLKRSLPIWVREKQVLRRGASGYLFRTRHPILSPARIAPASGYERDAGFTIDLPKLFDSAAVDRLEAVAAGQTVEDPGPALFLLGWYWLDQGEFSRAKAEFIAAAKAYMPRAGAESPEALFARRNALMMLVAAAAITEAPAGADASKTDFLDGLAVQARAWQRMWFANGLPASHAEEQEQVILAFMNRIRQRAGVARKAARHRYFFVDYRFRFGAVPDIILADAITMRLFESVPRNEDKRPIGGAVIEDGGDPAAVPTAEPLDFSGFLAAVYPPPKEIDAEILALPSE